jgi:hypothetical protein
MLHQAIKPCLNMDMAVAHGTAAEVTRSLPCDDRVPAQQALQSNPVLISATVLSAHVATHRLHVFSARVLLHFHSIIA